MRGVRIREASTSDVTGILECLRVALAPYRRKYTARAYVATVLTPPMAKRRLRSMTVLVALSPKGQVVGTVAIQRASIDHAHLRGMAVLPRHQGKGVATALLEAAIRLARTAGHRRVTLETTEPLRTAARFYLHHGFRRTGRSRHWGGMKLIGFERALGESPVRSG